MTDNQINRRALLGAIAVSPIAALATTAAIASPALPADRFAWDQAMAVYLEKVGVGAQADLLADAATAAYKAQAVPEPTKALKREFWPCSDTRHVLFAVDLDEHEKRIHDDGFGTPESRAVRIADVQAIRDYRAADETLRDRIGYDRTHEAWDDAASDECDAAWILIRLPAPDLAAVSWKLHYLFEECAEEDGYTPSYSNDSMAAIMADVRRLGGEARA